MISFRKEFLISVHTNLLPGSHDMQIRVLLITADQYQTLLLGNMDLS